MTEAAVLRCIGGFQANHRSNRCAALIVGVRPCRRLWSRGASPVFNLNRLTPFLLPLLICNLVLLSGLTLLGYIYARSKLKKNTRDAL